MTQQEHVHIGRVLFGNDLPLALIAGPCQIESHAHVLAVALALRRISDDLTVPVVFKSSFDKANRSSGKAPRGVGLRDGLDALRAVREETGLPILTDVHTVEQCLEAAKVVDCLQIPAFLCRQTDLLLAAGSTGLPVNIKKGQFLAPWDIQHAADKVADAGNGGVLLTERGSSFGYNALVTDMRSLPIMALTGHPVIFDATHSVQQPGGRGDRSGGQREFVAPLARAAVAVGVAGVFIETHPEPDLAPSDGPNMIPLSEMPALVEQLLRLDQVVKGTFR